MLEKDLENKIRRICELKNVVYWKFTSPSTRGVPDRILIFPNGLITFLELKAPGEKPGPLQAVMLKRLNDRRVAATYVDSIDDFLKWFNPLFDIDTLV